MSDTPPARATDWRGNPWTPESDTPAAHPNARFTAPASQCPSIAPEWEDPAGVPISAILFGGRRRTTVPLVTEAFDWEHGVFLGSIMASETTAAPAGRGRQAALRPDGDAAVLRLQLRRLLRPLAGDRQGHRSRQAAEDLLRQLVPARRRTAASCGPGYGENSRVLKWVFERVDGDAEAVDTAIGRLPAPARSTRPVSTSTTPTSTRCCRVDADGWRAAIPQIRAHYAQFGDKLPAQLQIAVDTLESQLTS